MLAELGSAGRDALSLTHQAVCVRDGRIVKEEVDRFGASIVQKHLDHDGPRRRGTAALLELSHPPPGGAPETDHLWP